MVAKVEGFVDYLVNDRTASDNLSGAVGFAKSEAAAANNYIQTHSADQIATDAGNFDFDQALLTVATAGAGEVIGGLVKAGGLALDLAEDAVASVGERAAVSDSKSALAAPEAGSIEAGSEATVASGEGAVATRAVQTELTQAVSATEPVLGSAADPIAGAANSAGEIAAASSPLQEVEEVAAQKVGNGGPVESPVAQSVSGGVPEASGPPVPTTGQQVYGPYYN